MFIINETLKAEKIPADREEELFRQHVAWFTWHFEQGDFLPVGPYTDREMAGIMICGAETRGAVEKSSRKMCIMLTGWPSMKSIPSRQGKSSGILRNTRESKRELSMQKATI
ncbi:YciI family protein [Dialister sp.]|uniref:YciI family protein n=1 Tax=Dialister sp. TaxID=1955814 RepID=UPI003F0E644F